MVDGFWIVRTIVSQGTGGAVVILTSGKLLGGDNGFYFMGTYYADQVSMKAHVTVHNFDPAVPSIFGITGEYELEVSATVQGDTMVGTAMLAGQPTKSIGLRLEKKSNL